MSLFITFWENARPYIPDEDKIEQCARLIESLQVNEVEIKYESATKGWWEVPEAFDRIEYEDA